MEKKIVLCSRNSCCWRIVRNMSRGRHRDNTSSMFEYLISCEGHAFRYSNISCLWFSVLFYIDGLEHNEDVIVHDETFR